MTERLAERENSGDAISAAIFDGLKDADEGRVVAHEDVVAWVRSWDGPNELPPPHRTDSPPSITSSAPVT